MLEEQQRTFATSVPHLSIHNSPDRSPAKAADDATIPQEQHWVMAPLAVLGAPFISLFQSRWLLRLPRTDGES